MIHRDKLSLKEIKNAFTNAKAQNDFEFDIIGFDACLMATLELADILQDFGKYLVASQENEGGGGWDYTTIFLSLNENPTQDGVTLGKTIAESYLTHTQDWDPILQRKDSLDVTLSVVDLSKMKSLNESFHELTKYLTNNLTEEEGPKVSASLRDSARYAVTGRGSDSGQMDILDFSKQVSKHILNPEVKALAQKVEQDVQSAVLYQVVGKFKQGDSNGISINLPKTVEDIPSDYRYSGTDETIQVYLNYLNNDFDAPDIQAWLEDNVRYTIS